MITDLSKEAAKYGLKLHLGKIKILPNLGYSSLSCAGADAAVLPTTHSEKYLGRKICMGNY